MAGRPAFQINTEVCDKAEALASQGLTRDQIAACLGMGSRTLYEKQAAYPQFAQALKDGVAKGIEEITNALMETARKGNVAAQIFYLKNRDKDNWKDGASLDVSVTQHSTMQEARGRLDDLLREGSDRLPESPVSH